MYIWAGTRIQYFLIYLYIDVIPLSSLLTSTPFIIKLFEKNYLYFVNFGEPCYSQQRPHVYFIDYMILLCTEIRFQL